MRHVIRAVALALVLAAPAHAADHPPGSPLNPAPGDAWRKAGRMEPNGIAPASELYVNAAVPPEADRRRLEAHAWIVLSQPVPLGRDTATEAELTLWLDCLERTMDPSPKMVDYDAEGKKVFWRGGTSKPGTPWVPIKPDSLGDLVARVVCAEG